MHVGCPCTSDQSICDSQLHCNEEKGQHDFCPNQKSTEASSQAVTFMKSQGRTEPHAQNVDPLFVVGDKVDRLIDIFQSKLKR